MVLKIIVLMSFPFLGGLLPLSIKSPKQLNLEVMLIIGGSYLLAACTVHMIPEAFSMDIGNVHLVGLFILLGFLVQLALEQLSHGMEHGHGCHNYNNCEPNKTTFGLLVSLSIHAFLESIPLAYNTHNWQLVLGIAIHHIPVGLLLTNHLIYKKLSKKILFSILGLFMCSSPLGYLAGFTVVASSFVRFTPLITAFAAGIILYISTTIVLESSSQEHKFSKSNLLSILGGIIIYFLFSNIFSHNHVH